MKKLSLPGLGDPSGKDSLHIAEMVKELKQLEYINSFLILFNAQNPRLDESLRAMVDIFTQIFGRDRFFDNVILVFTRWEHSARAERKRQRTGTQLSVLSCGCLKKMYLLVWSFLKSLFTPSGSDSEN